MTELFKYLPDISKIISAGSELVADVRKIVYSTVEFKTIENGFQVSITPSKPDVAKVDPDLEKKL